MNAVRRLLGSSAVSCVFTVLVMVGAGVAAASSNSSTAARDAREAVGRGGDPTSSETGNAEPENGAGTSDATGNPNGTADGDGASTACEDTIAASQGDIPASEDIEGIEQAIEVVSANCENNPQAAGLLNALQELLDNAERQSSVQESSDAGSGGHQAGGRVDGQGNGSGGHQAGGRDDGQGSGGDPSGGDGKGAGQTSG